MKEQLLKDYKDGLGIKDENTASPNQKLCILYGKGN